MGDDDVQQLVDEAVAQVGGVRGKEPEMTAEQVARALYDFLGGPSTALDELGNQCRQGLRLLICREMTARQTRDLEPQSAQPHLG